MFSSGNQAVLQPGGSCGSLFPVVHFCHDPILAKQCNQEILGTSTHKRSVGLHKLKGDRKRQWAVTVNGRWRMCFESRKGDAYNVEIVDHHKG